jgi:tRNA pseudouridine55 synthase
MLSPKSERQLDAGTLDPLATGLLVLGIESGTKLLTFLVGADKTYEATIRLGQSTVSDDSQSETIFTASPEKLANLNEKAVLEQIARLTGVISQTPSSVSAIKVDGKRAYDLVRAGETVELKKREVTVARFELRRFSRVDDFVDISVAVDCSSGTYIRALARDLGAALEVGGHITALRRTKVGNFDVSQASNLEQLENLKLIPLIDAARDLFPVIELEDSDVTDLVHGKRLLGRALAAGLVAGRSSEGELVAVLESANKDLKSVVVFRGVVNG